jgi:hypothetical protein
MAGIGGGGCVVWRVIARGARPVTVRRHGNLPEFASRPQPAVPVMATSRRKSSGRRWSATSTVELYDAAGARIGAGSPTAVVMAQVRYRLDGRNKKYVLRGGDIVAQVRSTQALLTVAYEQDWVADQRGRPVAPAALPTVGFPTTTGGPPAGAGGDAFGGPGVAQVLAFPGSELPGPALLPSAASLPAIGAAMPPADVATLVRWRKQFLKTSNSHLRGRGKRSPTTTGNYDTNLNFLLTHARYQPDDPRLAKLGIPAGAPMRLDHPTLGLNEHDLVALLDVRASTNLTIRAANERAMVRWATAMDKEQDAASRAGREPVLTAPPELREEKVEARTIEAFAQTVRSALKDAHLHQKIGFQPWTLVVESQVQRSAMPHYSTKTLPDRDQVHMVANSIAARWRRSTDAEGHPCQVNGARYQGLVVLAGREAPRPEESIAIRTSWVHLGDGDDRIELQWAEVNHPLPGGGRERTRVPLKGRERGEVRVIRLQPDTAAALRAHMESFVPRPDPQGLTEDERDPRVFTTHSGAPIDLGNFSRDWFAPAIASAFASPTDQHLATMPFRRLRAAAITDWISHGCTSGEASEKAGNSSLVIERHYRGVFDSRPKPQAGTQMTMRGGDIAVDLLDDVQLAALSATVMAERRHRLEQDAQMGGG